DGGPHGLGLAHGNPPLALGPREGVADFDRVDIRGQERVDPPVDILAELPRLVAVDLRQFPLGGHAGADDVPHGSGNSPRIFRMAGTAMSTRPCLSKISWRIFADRFRRRRTTAGSR